MAGVFALLLLASSATAGAQVILVDPAVGLPAELDAIARTELRSFLELAVTEASAVRLGFASAAQSRQARLGTPLVVAVVGRASLAAYAAGTPLARLWMPPAAVWYPVVVGGSTVCGFELARMGSRWVGAELGGRKEALAVSEALAALPGLVAKAGLPPGHDTVLVRVPALRAAFLYARGSSGELLVPAMPIPERIGLLPLRSYGAAQVLPALQAAAAKLPPGSVD
jgi:hypothetical protein